MRRLLRYLRPYRWRVVVAVLVLLCSAAVQLVAPWVTGLAIDRALPARNLTLLWQLGAVFAAAMVVSFAARAPAAEGYSPSACAASYLVGPNPAASAASTEAKQNSGIVRL